MGLLTSLEKSVLFVVLTFFKIHIPAGKKELQWVDKKNCSRSQSADSRPGKPRAQPIQEVTVALLHAPVSELIMALSQA